MSGLKERWSCAQGGWDGAWGQGVELRDQGAGEAVMGHSPGAKQVFWAANQSPWVMAQALCLSFPVWGEGVAQKTLAMQKCCKGIGATYS